MADGHRFVGFHGGWLGLREDDGVELTVENTSGLVTRGGTILGTSRTDPLEDGDPGLTKLRATLARRGIEALVVIGGDGTLRAGLELHRRGIPIVAVPKTIDNDVSGTDASVGFHTAVQIATDAIDRLHTTAESHNRVMVVEVMGRHAGWIAACAGMASGADMILVPERAFDIDSVCDHLRRRHATSHNFSIVVVAEGARAAVSTRAETSTVAAVAPQAQGSPRATHANSLRPPEGIGFAIREQIEARTGFDTRVTILGHVQRGGTPVAFDRMLATRFGVAATEAMLSGLHGTMTALHGTNIVMIPLEEALGSVKPLDPSLYEVASVFFD